MSLKTFSHQETHLTLVQEDGSSTGHLSISQWPLQLIGAGDCRATIVRSNRSGWGCQENLEVELIPDIKMVEQMEK